MKVNQIYELTNTITQELLGETAVVAEDLSNIVDIGKAVMDANQVDNYVKSLIDHIGKVVFVDRPYSGRAPSVLMDGWEFGSVLEKITMAELPEATENESWNLVDKQVYEQDTFYKPSVEVKFFNSKTTFEVPISITRMQVQEAFSSAQQLNAFISMIYTAIDTTLTVRIDALIMRAINNFTAMTLATTVPGGDYANQSNPKAVNLLYLYNTIGPNKGGTALTKDQALTNLDFLKYASYIIALYKQRVSSISTIFNLGGKERFTPNDRLHIVLHDMFAKASDVYLQSDTYHNDLVNLPRFETVSYWQGTGVDYEFDSTSKIDVVTQNPSGTGTISVELDGVLGVMFDRDALGVANQDNRVTSHYNAKAEFTNFWYKRDASYFNDGNENFIVFYIQ